VVFTIHDIQHVCDQIVAKFKPDSVILFGSYATGQVTLQSDVDLLVVMPFSGKKVYQSVQIASAIEYPFPLDLLVRRPEEVIRRYKGRDPLIREALDKGIVLYEREQGYSARIAS